MHGIKSYVAEIMNESSKIKQHAKFTWTLFALYIFIFTRKICFFLRLRRLRENIFHFTSEQLQIILLYLIPFYYYYFMIKWSREILHKTGQNLIIIFVAPLLFTICFSFNFLQTYIFFINLFLEYCPNIYLVLSFIAIYTSQFSSSQEDIFFNLKFMSHFTRIKPIYTLIIISFLYYTFIYMYEPDPSSWNFFNFLLTMM